MFQRSQPRFLAGIALALALTLGVVGCTSTAPSDAPQHTAAPVSALPAGTHIGAVELRVRDLESVTAFYHDVVGIPILAETENDVTLGFEAPLIRLSSSDAAPDDPTQAGLYHSAILFPDEATLANTLTQIAQLAPESLAGASDHSVSQAFYFTDPEGNGLELYVDRPAEKWVWQNGQVRMTSKYLDPSRFISEHADSDAPVGNITMGHAHLRVGDIDTARAFYVDGLGFAETSAGDGAAFFGADGYHHHIGVNVWSSAGAGQRPELAGLGSLTIWVPDAAALDEVQSRLESAGFQPTRDGSLLTVADPWGSPISVQVTGAPLP